MRQAFLPFLLLLTQSVQAAPKPLDPIAQAILNNDLTAIRANISAVNAKLLHGDTPLMYAAAYGTLDAVKLLLEEGADVNAKSDNDSTALMFGAGDAAKAKLLVAHGADVNAASKPGRTPLLIAALSDGTIETVKLLIANGANPLATDKEGLNLLIAAAGSGNTAAVKLALEKHVPVNASVQDGTTALMAAASDANTEAVKLLLAAHAEVNAVSAAPQGRVKMGVVALGRFTALILATTYGPSPLVKMLLDAGAEVNVKDARGLTPLHLAVSSEVQNPEIVRMLLAKGASPDAKSDETINGAAESPADWAAKFQYPAVMSLLKVSRSSGKAPVALSAEPNLRASVERSLDLLERTGSTFAREGGCVSCHNQNITSMAVNVARSHGFAPNAAKAAERTALANAFWGTAAEGFLLRLDPPGGVDSINFMLFGFAADGVAGDATTSAMTHNLAANQRVNGSWHSAGIARVPIEDSDIARTAMAISCLRQFGVVGTQAEYAERIQRAGAWLMKAKPRYQEEFDFQLLGLKWAGAPAESWKQAAAAIRARQSASGGWPQNPNLPEDAYATGQALYALHEGAGLPVTDPAYQKGITFLLNTQHRDGSWHIRSRAPKFQPYFQSGFPYGHDQWISSAGTGWAAMALALAVERDQRASR